MLTKLEHFTSTVQGTAPNLELTEKDIENFKLKGDILEAKARYKGKIISTINEEYYNKLIRNKLDPYKQNKFVKKYLKNIDNINLLQVELVDKVILLNKKKNIDINSLNVDDIFNVLILDIDQMELLEKLNNIKSRRGRKSNVKKQCNFSSQIQFSIKSSNIEGKLYKIKCFRKKSVNISGVLNYDLSDIKEIIKKLDEFLQEYDIDISGIIYKRNMSNFKFKIIKTKDQLLPLDRIYKSLIIYKEKTDKLSVLYKYLDKDMSDVVRYYLGNNRIGMKEIIYNSNGDSSKIIIKFHRYNKNDNMDKITDKRTNVYIFKTGKINIMSGFDIKQVRNIYKWLDWFFQNYVEFISYSDLQKRLKGI